MRYLVDILQIQAKKIQKLIEEGKYESVAQFLSVALENQIYLEESGEAPVVISEEKKDVESDREGKQNSSSLSFESIKLRDIQSNPETVYVPTFKDLSLSNGIKKEEDVWLWGQINKIFPIKIGLRVLLRELSNEKWIEFDDFVEKATEEAASIGQQIRRFEEKNNKKRGEKISAGLPFINEEKSQTRYKAHFLAYQRKDGLLNGAMAILRFVNIKKDESSGSLLIGLTKQGVKFAKIINPPIDESKFDLSLNDDEAKYYLSHIEQCVISEYAAIKWLLKTINNGIQEREALNKELKKSYGEVWQASDAVINTQRAGLMARMHELGLLKKKKNGIYVTYHLSEFGQNYLTKN